MNITAIGISHHTAAVGVREAFSLPGDLAGRLLRALKNDGVLQEALVLDTCNRTEVYFVCAKCDDPLGYLLGHIARLKGMADISDTSAFYVHRGIAAVTHVFRVAAGLESQIVGEHQILGQLKAAYRLACEVGTTHFFMNKLLHWAFRVGKRAQNETELGRGSASVAQAAVELAQQVFSTLEGKSVMLVGAGETGALAAKALVRCGTGNVIVANRNIDRARTVAEGLRTLNPQEAEALGLEDAVNRCPALRKLMEESPLQQSVSFDSQAITLEQVPDFVGGVDLIICATGAPDMVLTGERITKSLAKSNRSVLIVDIAVPRDADPKLDRLPNVFLYNIDDLDQLVARNIASRQLEVPRVEAIIADELSSFRSWYDSLQVTPTIKLLRKHFSEIQAAEIKQQANRFRQTDQEQLEQFTRSLCNKILHRPIAFLRSLSEETSISDRQAAVDMIRKAFGLDGPEDRQ